MDLSEDEEDADKEIESLLKALEGIERCFVIDPEVLQARLQPISTPSVTARKRSIEPDQSAAPAPLKNDLKDPRLEKIRSSPIVPQPLELPVPSFVRSDNCPDASSPKKRRLESIKISDQLARYLDEHPSKNSKTSAIAFDGDASATKRTNIVDSSVETVSIASRKTLTLEERARRECTLGLVSKSHQEGTSIDSSLMRNSPGEELPLLVSKLNREALPVDTSSVPNDPRTPEYFTRRRSRELLTSPLESRLTVDTTRKEIRQESVQSVDNVPGLEKALLDVHESESAKESIIASVKKKTLRKIIKERLLICGNNAELPSEMLIEIFNYLPLRDKKNAKLVCKRWCEICNIRSFVARQRFVCCGMYDTNTVLQTLAKSECTYFNLEFHRVHFSDAHSEHWKKLGPKIHALYFADCVLTEEMLEDVIVNCTEMEHLSLVFERLKVPSVRLFSLALFESLFKRDIRRPKMISLDLQLSANGWFSNAIVSNFLSIYPNVSRLGFTCHSLNPVARGVEAVPPDEINFTDLWSSKSLTFSPIIKKVLSPPDSMEKLRLDAHTKGLRTGFAWQLVIAHSEFTRLREIAMEIDLKKLSANAIIEFCAAQQELKSLTCKIVGPAKLFISLFLLNLLDNCSRLRHLSITHKGEFRLSYELYRKLGVSNLKSLSIDSSYVSLAPQIADEINWVTNEHLRSLTLSDGVGDSLKTVLILIFRNLRFLEINDLSDELLQLIWKYQTRLISLKLAGVEECTISGFCGTFEGGSSYSIRNLQNLEYLVLETVNSEWQVYGNVFSEFQFPKLRYFCVDIEGSSTLQSDLIETMQNFTELEAVSITCSGVPRSSWLSVNNKWRQLRYLRIVDKESDKFKERHYHRYFKVSPKLRAVFHESKGSTDSYYYDVLEKRVKRKVYQAKYRISSEKVGNSFIDWLWF